MLRPQLIAQQIVLRHLFERYVNLLLFYPTEIDGAELVLRAERARWVNETFRISVGDSIVCGLLNGKIGRALIKSSARDEVRALVNLEKEPPPRILGELIVGLSRPQTIKKVLHFAASVGIESLRLVRCERSEKSYLDSHLLREDELNAELDLGLSQGVDTVRPKVVIHQTFSGMVRAFASGAFRDAPVKWVGDATSGASETGNSNQIVDPPNRLTSFAVAVGPERGFSMDEISALRADAGFEAVSLGSRQLRVEFALASLVGRCISMTSA